jgi:hypothetical protein
MTIGKISPLKGPGSLAAKPLDAITGGVNRAGGKA